MIPSDAVGLFVGAVVLGAVHGIEPGHGWPVAASYALDQSNKWLYGLAASVLLGVGHLVSSIAMVVAFFFAKRYFELARVNEPLDVLGVRIGGPVGIVAGVVLVLLGVREYLHGHGHDHGGHSHANGGGHSHDIDGHSREDGEHGHDSGVHSHDDQRYHVGGNTSTYGLRKSESGQEETEPSHDHSHRDQIHEYDHGDGDARDHHDENRGILGRIALALPFVGGHSHGSPDEAAERGLWGIAGFAFVLGFAHEEEFEIIAMCAGSDYCLSLMTVYALTVVVGIVTFTLLLIAGYERYEERVERYTDYLPAFSAAVLILMGLGFVMGLF